MRRVPAANLPPGIERGLAEVIEDVQAEFDTGRLSEDQLSATLGEQIATPGTPARVAVDAVVSESGGGGGAPGPRRTAWGHSLVAATTNGAAPWEPVLGELLGQVVSNQGIGGQRSDQIAARQGGAPVRFTVEGGEIPANGSVNVTLPFAINNSGSIPGTLAGVEGTFTRTGALTGTFTRTTSGDTVPTPIAVPFFPTVGAGRRQDVTYLWTGRNDLTVLPTEETVANTARMIQYLSVNRRYLVFEEPPTSTDTPGSAGRTRLDTLNAAMRQAFPDAWVPVMSWLRTEEAAAAVGHTFTTQDLDDIENEITPASFRTDGIHLNTLGNRALAWRIYLEEVARGWTLPTTGPLPEPATVYILDTFTRADSAELGTTEEGGLAWTAATNGGQATWALADGKATVTGGPSSIEAYVTYATHSDGRLSCKLGANQPSGLLWRATNTSSGYVAYYESPNWVIKKRNSLSSFTTLASQGGAAPADGTEIAVEIDGSTFTLFVNGAEVATATDSSYTGTRLGLWKFGPVAVAWDDFKFTE